MNANQELLIKFISKSIRNISSKSLFTNTPDWEGIFCEAKLHDVHTLIYPAFKEYFKEHGTDDVLSEKWGRAALIEGAVQLQNIEEASSLLKGFNEEGIEIIALKGFIIRELYPTPELRTMTDVDLLVHKKDLKQAFAILNKSGYVKHATTSKHISFEKNNLIIEGVVQLQNIEEASSLLKGFNEEGIDTIALKGFIIRELYPTPELRTMTDVDLLVHKKDLKQAFAILHKSGYVKHATTSKHISFEKNNLIIELHKVLLSELSRPNLLNFDDEVWDNVIYIEVRDQSVLTLNHEYQLLYLCLHMAEHLISSGFGLRQLCDFVIFVEKYKDSINWMHFIHKVRMLGIERFTAAIFLICHSLFELELPSDISMLNTKEFNLDSSELMEAFIEEIVGGGVYGKSSEKRQKSSTVQKFMINSKAGMNKGLFDYFARLLFPSVESLCGRYSYCLRYRALIPFAWIHRLVFGIIRRDFSLKEKAALLINPPDVTELDGRIRLIHWLGLL